MKPHPGPRLRAGLALLLALSPACSPRPARPVEPPYAVVQRVAEVAGRAAERVKLGTEVRNGVALPATETFEVTLDRPAQDLLFSIAARSTDPARFAIRAHAGGRWVDVYEAEIAPGEPAWQDRRLEPAALRGSGARRFRFESRAGPEGIAYWGSLAFLGDSRRLRDAPNVILLSLDTLSAAYLSSFGGVPGVSPNLDAFLDEGFSFRRAFAQYGNTLVSHASLFTGLYPRTHSVYPDSPFTGFASLVEELAAAGYVTAAFTEGAFVASAWGFGRGFDLYDDGAVGLARQMAGGAARTFDRAGRWLERHARDTRFFLFVHTYEVHLPYRAESDAEWQIVERITPGDQRRLPEAQQARRSLSHNAGGRALSPRDLAHLRALHIAEIHRLDAAVARFLTHLSGLGRDADTLVVLASDHGEQFGEHGRVGHGSSLHNRVLHVPLGFRWPGRIAPGASDTPVQLVDVLPTVLELTGVARADGLDGRSLVPLLQGEPAAERPAFSEMRSAPGECRRLELEPGCRVDRHAVQDRRFKLIHSARPEYHVLYDLVSDPLETRNVAAEYPEELARLRELLERYLERPAGPVARGEAAVPDEPTRLQLEALGYAR